MVSPKKEKGKETYMKKTILIVMTVLVALVLAVSCSGSPKTQKKDSYTVTFKLKGCTCPEFEGEKKVQVKAGETVEEPISSTFTPNEPKYYKFAGWTKEGKQYDFNTPVNSDITLETYLEPLYSIGGRGEAYGLVFYENPNYNANSTDNNWKYLEVTAKDYGDSITGTEFAWGTKGVSVGTSTAINSGSTNTEKMSELTSSVAKNIWNKTGDGGKTDWYIPSKDELALIFKEVAAKGNGNFSGYYWSSSAKDNDSAWNLSTNESASGEHSASRDTKCHIRLIRKF